MTDYAGGMAIRQRVLVVDDELNSLRAFTRNLEHAFEVFSAQTAAEALTVAERVNPVVVITDFAMPGTNGVELARELGVRMPNVSVVMVTGFPDLPDVIRAHRERLIAALLVKPWGRDEMLETVGQLARLHTMRSDVDQLVSKNAPSGL
jgi:two-component system response regulator HupR/HoxA